MVKKAIFILALCLLALGLTACSLPSTTLVSSTDVTSAVPIPTQPPLDASNANSYDHGAGNCPDAANQAINILNKSALGDFGGTSFGMDMNLALTPSFATSGCADSPIHVQLRYREYVSYAHLTVYPLTTDWSDGGAAIREQWLADVLNALLRLYPRANITITVIFNNVACGTAGLAMGQPRTMSGACG